MKNLIEEGYTRAQHRDKMMRLVLKEWVRTNKPLLDAGEPLIPMPIELAEWVWLELDARLAFENV